MRTNESWTGLPVGLKRLHIHRHTRLGMGDEYDPEDAVLERAVLPEKVSKLLVGT
jgi:hypothetical protein